VAKTTRQSLIETIETIETRPWRGAPVWALAIGAWLIPLTVICTPVVFAMWWARRGRGGLPRGVMLCTVLGSGPCATWLVLVLVHGVST